MQLECTIDAGVPCIYEIHNIKTGCRYVGSTTRYRNRFREHRRLLRSGEHHSKHLQNSFNKHGEQSFRMRPLEIVADAIQLIAREQRWIDATIRQSLYNRSRIAGRAGTAPKPVYSIHPVTGEKRKYESATAAAIEIHETPEALTLINKAIRKLAKSGGLFWVRKKKTTLDDIKTKKASLREDRRSQLPFCVFSFRIDGTMVGEYRTISDAARATGASAAQISSAILSGKYRTAAGLTWSELRIPKAVKSRKTKAVLQIKCGVVLQRWASCIDAANALPGASYKGISGAATGYTKSHRGFQWVFDKN